MNRWRLAWIHGSLVPCAALGIALIFLHGGSPAAAVLYGDATCDGRANSIDAAVILQLDAGIIHSVGCPLNADVNSDGHANSIDASLVLQYDAGLISALGPITCGVERWSVKTLSDPDAGLVDFTPVLSTVAQLRLRPTPGNLPDNSRIAPTELTTYRLVARLVKFKLEDDHDIHLVIADQSDPSLTMIVEFPDASLCAGAMGSAHAAEMRTARAALVAAQGQPSSSHFTDLSGTATVTGVGFFDFLHGQTGVAPNGIELHPVLSFTLSGGGPTPTIAPTPTLAPGPVTYPCEATDCNCSDFPTHAEAQRVFLLHGGSPSNNWSGLDADHDGLACESLP